MQSFSEGNFGDLAVDVRDHGRGDVGAGEGGHELGESFHGISGDDAVVDLASFMSESSEHAVSSDQNHTWSTLLSCPEGYCRWRG